MGNMKIANTPSRGNRIPCPAIICRFEDVHGQSACYQHAMIFIVKVDRLNIGQAAYFKALIAGLPLAGADVIQLKEAIERRAPAQLERMLQPLPIDAERKQILRRLPAFDSGPLDDNEVALAADQMAAMLEREENDSSAR